MKTLRIAASQLGSVPLYVFLSCLIAAGCGGSGTDLATTTGTADLTDLSRSIGVTSVMAIEGIYGTACTSRSGLWVIPLNGYVPAAGENPLGVLMNDIGCTLSVTRVKVGTQQVYQLYQSPGPIPLMPVYAWQGTPFMLLGTNTPQFYANFRVTPDLSFNSDFIVQMTFADSVSETSLGNTAVYAVASGGGGVTQVPAPNAGISLDGLTVAVDTHNIVRSATGSVTLTQGSIAAGSFIIDTSPMPSSPNYGTVDAVFKAGVPTTMVGETQQIPAESLHLVGLSLTTPQRVNIVAADTRNGVSSYQVFEITFHMPNIP